MKSVLVMPIGHVDRKTMDFIAGAIRKTCQCEVIQGEPASVPENTCNPRRGQYNSTRILKALEVLKPDAYELLLGVVDEDLYVPELNFVFGEADMLAGVAVIALPRLRQEFYGLEPDPELFLQRAAKEAIHELGHTKRLGHCPDPRCVMHFSNRLEDTDVKAVDFCSNCSTKLAELK